MVELITKISERLLQLPHFRNLDITRGREKRTGEVNESDFFKVREREKEREREREIERYLPSRWKENFLYSHKIK